MGEEAGADCWISALPETALLQGAGLIIGRLLFYMTYFPDGFPVFLLMPLVLTY